MGMTIFGGSLFGSIFDEDSDELILEIFTGKSKFAKEIEASSNINISPLFNSDLGSIFTANSYLYKKVT